MANIGAILGPIAALLAGAYAGKQQREREAQEAEEGMQRTMRIIESLRGRGAPSATAPAPTAPSPTPLPSGMMESAPIGEVSIGATEPVMQPAIQPQYAQIPPQPQPQTQPMAVRAPVAPRSDLTVTGVTLGEKGKLKGINLGRLTERQSDREAVIAFHGRVKSGMSPKEAMEQGEAEGLTMNNKLRETLMAQYFEDTAQMYFKQLKATRPNVSTRDLMLQAASQAGQEVGAEHAGPRWSKYTDELAANVFANDPSLRQKVADVITDTNKRSDERAAEVLKLTGESPQKLGMSIPVGRQRGFEQLPPETQAKVLTAPQVILPGGEGPIAVRPTPGTPLPKPPMPALDRRTLVAAQQGLELVRDVDRTYAAMVKAHGTARFSAKLRESISANQNVQKLDNLTNLVGQTPTEVKFAAAYNEAVANLRTLSGKPESQFSDKDALLKLKGLGSAALGRAAFPAQLRALSDFIANGYNLTLDSMPQHDTSAFKRIDVNIGRQFKTKDGSVKVYAGTDAQGQPIYMTKEQYMQQGR